MVKGFAGFAVSALKLLLECLMSGLARVVRVISVTCLWTHPFRYKTKLSQPCEAVPLLSLFLDLLSIFLSSDYLF